MKNRHDPAPTLRDQDKLAWLGAVQRFFGEKWLADASNESSPLFELWHRTDWLASLELLTFGRSIVAARQALSHEPWLNDHARRMRQHNPNGARGSAFEILLCSMLATGAQTVALPPPNQPGHDLVLVLPNGKRLRVSCKALAPSQYDATLRAKARTAFHLLRSELRSGSALHIALETPSAKAVLPASSELLWVARGGQTLARGTVFHTRIGPWRTASFPLARLHDADFSPDTVSLGLSVFAPLHGDEQKRFDDKIDDACANLSQHFPTATDHEGAIIAMSVPEEVSLPIAKSYAAESGLDRHPSVSGLMLIRTQVCANGADIGLAHEVAFVANRRAQFKVSHYTPPGGLRLSMLFGNLVGKTPVEAPTQSPYFPPNPMAMHAFERQHHHYVRHYKGSSIPAEQPPHQLGLSCEWTFLGPKRIDIRFTSCVPERELILL